MLITWTSAPVALSFFLSLLHPPQRNHQISLTWSVTLSPYSYLTLTRANEGGTDSLSLSLATFLSCSLQTVPRLQYAGALRKNATQKCIFSVLV